MEPRAALGHWDTATGRGTLWAGSGGAVRQKTELAEVLGVPPDRVRVVSLDVGGNFGTRNRLYVESGLVLWASRRLGRPVKYTSTRSIPDRFSGPGSVDPRSTRHPRGR